VAAIPSIGMGGKPRLPVQRNIPPSPGRIMQTLAFSSLLYRYLFFGWLFRDASQGTVWERSAALRHNKEQAHWLLTYIRRWVVLGGILLAVAAFTELVLRAPLLSAFFYVPTALTLTVSSLTTYFWLALSFGNLR
jgi:hypothetical protein